ncbi:MULTISPECIES: hypothetical protein [Levilactobacillus]|uniref:hypothetical protein n=1 Tax=Levilactobacillus TaxID=2767886 RepID=UPI003756F561
MKKSYYASYQKFLEKNFPTTSINKQLDVDVAKDFVPEETTSRHIKKNRKASTFDKFGRG